MTALYASQVNNIRSETLEAIDQEDTKKLKQIIDPAHSNNVYRKTYRVSYDEVPLIRAAKNGYTDGVKSLINDKLYGTNDYTGTWDVLENALKEAAGNDRIVRILIRSNLNNPSMDVDWFCVVGQLVLHSNITTLGLLVKQRLSDSPHALSALLSALVRFSTRFQTRKFRRLLTVVLNDKNKENQKQITKKALEGAAFSTGSTNARPVEYLDALIDVVDYPIGETDVLEKAAGCKKQGDRRVQRLLARGTNLEQSGHDALIRAISRGNKDAFDALLNAGASLDTDGADQVFDALWSQGTSLTSPPYFTRCVQMALRNKAQVRPVDIINTTKLKATEPLSLLLKKVLPNNPPSLSIDQWRRACEVLDNSTLAGRIQKVIEARIATKNI